MLIWPCLEDLVVYTWVACISSKLKECVTARLCATEKQNTSMRSCFCYTIWIKKSQSRQTLLILRHVKFGIYFFRIHTRHLDNTLSTTRLDPVKEHHVICAVALDDDLKSNQRLFQSLMQLSFVDETDATTSSATDSWPSSPLLPRLLHLMFHLIKFAYNLRFHYIMTATESLSSISVLSFLLCRLSLKISALGTVQYTLGSESNHFPLHNVTQILIWI